MKKIRLSKSDFRRLFGSTNPLAPLKVVGNGRRVVKARRGRSLGVVTRALAWARDQAGNTTPGMSVFVVARLKNHANGAQGGKWRAMAVAKERKSDRSRITDACRAGRIKTTLPVAIRMIRLGPRKMDTGGLWNALKSIQDGIAEDFYGRKDDDPAFTWTVDQELSPTGCFGCRVEFSYDPF